MSRGDRKRLEDMLEALDDLGEVRARGRDAYDDDRLLRLAAQRALEVLGEAAKTVSDELREANADVEWSLLARTRDLIAHHYHRLDDEAVWRVVEDDAPALRDRVRRLAADLEA